MKKCKTCQWFITGKCQCPEYPSKSPPRDPEFGCILWEPARDNRACKEATHDIFIRTCAKDLPWLRYCLQGIHRFTKGFRQVVIVAPNSARPGLERWGLTLERVHYIQEYKNDYLGQQITKLHADTWTDADYIWFVDSDVIFNRPTTPDLMFCKGKPVYYLTPVEQVGDIPWIGITEMFLGWRPRFEYMRRMPMMYPGDMLVNFRTHAQTLHKIQVGDWIEHNQKFSEFNAFGAWAHRFQPDRFYWWNTVELEQPPPFATQFWTWGGITPDVKAKIERILQ